MKTIIAAIDNSAGGRKAAQVAAELASQCNAPLLLTHSVSPLFYASDWGASQVPDMEMAAQTASQALLDEQCASLKQQFPRLSVEARQLNGNAADTVAELAVAVDADLVVVGSRSMGVLGRIALGSVSSRLVHTCTRSVLVVP